ncbi:unnamed protein product [Prunus brigantina]
MVRLKRWEPFKELSKSSKLFQKLMENAGTMEEHVEGKEDSKKLMITMKAQHLLSNGSMKRGDPAWIGCIYALSIFTVYSSLSSHLVCSLKAQYFQNVMRVSFRNAHKYVKQLHGLWSAPFRITVAMLLLYQQLGVASLIGSMMLILMIPIQTIVISKIRKLAKDGLQQTDERVGLVNEILAAMDNVKYDSTPLTRLEELFLTEERILVPNQPLEPGLPAIPIKDA